MPRTISENIFKLVQSLSKPEKRYFKFYASMGNTANNMIYLQLFDAIDTQKKYNENKIFKKIRQTKSQLSSSKKYLEELILESLQLYHAQKSVSARLLSYLSIIEILFNKNLFTQCITQIKKAKALAMKYEKHHLLGEIYQLEHKTLTALIADEKTGAKLNTLLADNVSNAFNITKEAEYFMLNERLFRYYRKEGHNEALSIELAKIMQDPMIKDNKKPATLKQRFYYNRIHGVYYYLQKDWNNYYKFQKKIIDDFESQPHRIEELPLVYLGSLNNFLISCAWARRGQELENAFGKANDIMQNASYAKNRNIITIFISCGSNVIYYYNRSGEFRKAVPLSIQIENLLCNVGDVAKKLTRIYAYHTFAHTYFGIGSYKQALVWLNKIINDKDTGVRNDVQISARLMNLLIHFELGNESVLEYITKSTYRFLLRHSSQYKFGAILIHFIAKKIPKINSRTELIVAFKELKIEIEKIAQNRDEQKMIEYFDFISWLESKITGEPFAALVKEKWNKQSKAQSWE